MPSGVTDRAGRGPEAKPGSEVETESVRCLECGALYGRPIGGGTVRENPGCPECGYIGWARTASSVRELRPRRFAVGRPRRRNG